MTDPVDFLLRAAMRLPRPEIERLTEGMIAALDTLDGDTDLEDSFDREFVEEREIEPYEGGHADEWAPWHRAIHTPDSNIRWIRAE